MSAKLISQLKRHEGFERFAYTCPAGYLTIGYGRNIEANGITDKEAEHLLVNDIQQAESDAKKYLGESAFNQLDKVRQCVLINLAFNLGLTRLRPFKKTREALLAKDYNRAANQLMKSKWYRQVKSRGVELVEQMRTGKWQF